MWSQTIKNCPASWICQCEILKFPGVVTGSRIRFLLLKISALATKCTSDLAGLCPHCALPNQALSEFAGLGLVPSHVQVQTHLNGIRHGM